MLSYAGLVLSAVVAAVVLSRMRSAYLYAHHDRMELALLESLAWIGMFVGWASLAALRWRRRASVPVALVVALPAIALLVLQMHEGGCVLGCGPYVSW